MAFEREPIGSIKTWVANLQLDPTRYSALTSDEIEAVGGRLQTEVARIAYELGTSIVGFYEPTEPPQLVITREPDSREDATVPSIDDCEAVVVALANRLGAERSERRVIPIGGMLAIHGTFAGYGTERATTVEGISAALPTCDVAPGYRVYARVANGEVVEEWPELVGVVRADLGRLAEIYEHAERTQQSHIPVHGEQRTDMYATHWADS